MALIGRIVAMTGVASLISDNGAKRDLQLGDSIQTGDTIQTLRGVEVDLELANGRVIHISAEQIVAFTEELAGVFVPDALDNSINLATIDTVIKAIEDGKDINEVLEETAAGIGGQSNSYGFGFVDLLRVNSELSNSGFAFDTNVADRLDSVPAAVINDALVGSGTTVASTIPAASSPTSSSNVAILTSATQNLTETDAVLSTGGTLVLTDLDATAATVVPQTAVAGSYGNFTIDAGGVWSYSTSSALNQLNAGQTVSEVFTVATTDGGGASVTVTITGSNDVP
ncbi:MAG: retention module-containing protein, partial [Methylotenera sp.]